MDKTRFVLVLAVSVSLVITSFIITYDTHFKAKPIPAIVTITIPKGHFEDPDNNRFTPQAVKVVIDSNNTITWLNKDNVTYEIDLGTSVGSPISFKIAPNGTYTHTFTDSGFYEYEPGYLSGSNRGIIAVVDPAQLKRQPVMISNGTTTWHANINDIEPNTSFVFTYPITGNKTLDDDLYKRW